MSDFFDVVNKTAAGLSESEQTALSDLMTSFKAGGNPAPPIEEVEEVVPEVVLGDNQILLSSITNGRLPASGVDRKITIYPHGYFSADISRDIPDVDYDYHWDADVLEAIAIGHQLNERVLLQGYPGTGKTTAVKQFAAWIQQPYMKLGGKDGIDQSSFLGYAWAGPGGMEFKEGLLPQGLRDGYLICIDEIFKIPAGIQMAMQSLYEKNGTLMIDDKPGTISDKEVHPHSDSRLFTTDNVLGTGDDIGKFASTQVQDTSTLDRIGMTIKVNYLDKTQEQEMFIKKFPKINKVYIAKLVSLANLVRTGYAQDNISLTLSPRGLQTILSIVDEAELSMEAAIKLAFVNKLADDQERVAVTGFINSIKF